MIEVFRLIFAFVVKIVLRFVTLDNFIVEALDMLEEL